MPPVCGRRCTLETEKGQRLGGQPYPRGQTKSGPLDTISTQLSGVRRQSRCEMTVGTQITNRLSLTRYTMIHLARRKLFCFVGEILETSRCSLMKLKSKRKKYNPANPESLISKFDTCLVRPAKYFGLLRIRWLMLVANPTSSQKGAFVLPQRVGKHARFSSRQIFDHLVITPVDVL